MEKTKKLYEINPYLKEFHATVLEQTKMNEFYHVVLDQTAFYPTGGGQPFDKGTLNLIPVVDVYKKEGIIYHVLQESLEGQTEVIGQIDWERRFDHMQQHAGQHILSRAFEILYDIETIGFHLGEQFVTIDLSTDRITNEMIEKVEQLANRIVMENRQIEKILYDVSELPEDAIKKIPELDDQVRLVDIEQFDSCPCAGTHPDYTGEIGLIKTLGQEVVRKNIRLTFVCGYRALSTFRNIQEELSNISTLLKTNWFDVTKKTKQIIEEQKVMESQIRSLKTELLPIKIEEWKKRSEKIGDIYYLEAIIENADPQETRQIAQGITQTSSYIVMIVNQSEEKIQFFLQRSDDVAIPMNEVLKVGLDVIDGKGGGNAKSAQGGSNRVDQLEQAVAEMKDYIIHSVK